MTCSLDEICRKDVISIDNGCRVGVVTDAEVDTKTGQTVSLIVKSLERGLRLGKNGVIKIAWCDIAVIGDETILVKNVKFPEHCHPEPKSKRLSDLVK